MVVSSLSIKHLSSRGWERNPYRDCVEYAAAKPANLNRGILLPLQNYSILLIIINIDMSKPL